MGLPGAGKSVQSGLIRDRLGFHWLSTGQLLRDTKDAEVSAVQQSGALVNDELMFKLVGNELKEVGYDTTFLLDGFPRTVEQAEWLIKHGRENGKHIRLVLYLKVDEKIAIERLGNRGRPDDQAETIKKRQEEARKIEPTLAYLAKQGIRVAEIAANGDVESIFKQIKAAVEGI